MKHFAPWGRGTVLTSYKLILGIGLVSILSISFFSYITTSSTRNEMINLIETSGHQMSETVKSSTKFSMLNNQTEHLHHIIDFIGKQSGIQKVRIINKVGGIIYSSDKSEISNMIDKKAEACYACHTADKPLEKLSISMTTRIFTDSRGARYLGIINPIYNESSCTYSTCHAHSPDKKVLGVLDITMPLKDVDDKIRLNQIKLIAVAFSSIAVICFFLMFFVHRLIGRPVRDLLKATSAVSDGNFNYKIEMDRKHELSNLANAFNTMTQKLAETQKQLYQNDKLASLGQLAAGVAHEINNPLTGVLTYSSYHLKRIEKDQIDKTDLKESLEVIVRETKRCREIVKNLLDFARQVPPKKIRINVNTIIEQSIIIIENQLIIHNVLVSKNFKNDLPEIRVDKNQIQQVIINLLVNALHAIGNRSGGKIGITTAEVTHDNRNFIRISIEDNGCGIAREHLANIFEPFFSTKGNKGTGLGLSVAWGIIDEHGGKIDVESEQGKGTIFSIILPMDDPAKPMTEIKKA